MNTLLYRRVSTDHQDNSLAVQEHLNDEYCARLPLAVLASYADDDVSGSVPFGDRPGSRALLERLRRGDVRHLVTAKQDRLGRDTLDTIGVIRAVWELGVTPHFPAEGGAFPRTPENELLFEIKASVAQYERNLIRERTRTVLRHKAARGELTGTVPYGFWVAYGFADGSEFIENYALSAAELAPRIARCGAVTGKDLVPREAEQAVLREMAAWRGRGLTLNQIARRLNDLGIPAKRGGRWSVGAVAGLLGSRSAQTILAAPLPAVAPAPVPAPAPPARIRVVLNPQSAIPNPQS